MENGDASYNQSRRVVVRDDNSSALVIRERRCNAVIRNAGQWSPLGVLQHNLEVAIVVRQRELLRELYAHQGHCLRVSAEAHPDVLLGYGV